MLIYWILDQIFLCDPVVLEWICYCTRAKRLINNSKMTGKLRKIWTVLTRPNFFLGFSRIRVDLLLYESIPTGGLRNVWTGSRETNKILSVKFSIFIPVQIFFCNPVVLESICYRARVNKLINKSNIWIYMNINKYLKLLSIPSSWDISCIQCMKDQTCWWDSRPIFIAAIQS